MRYEAEVKERLISNAIHLIAEGGFEKATTKELALYAGHLPDIKMNETYIYRFFGGKEGLFEAAFLCLDNELYHAFRSGTNAVGGFEGDAKSKLYEFFLMAWRFILGNEARCRCYIRYYYSIYFKGRVILEHKKRFDKVVAELYPMFKDEADVGAILHSVFIMFFDFGIRVLNGEIVDDEINRPHIFNVLYCMMMTYFKQEETAPVCAG